MITDKDGNIITGEDENGQYVKILDTGGQEVKRYPDNDNINFKKAVASSKKYQEDKAYWKKTALEAQEKKESYKSEYNKVNEEYSNFKDSKDGMEDQMKNLRGTITKELKEQYDQEYGEKFTKQEKFINKTKHQQKESLLLKSNFLNNNTNLPKSEYINILGKYVQEDGTFLDRAGQVMVDANGNNITDVEKFSEVIINTHPDKNDILVQSVKTGQGINNEHSANTPVTDTPAVTVSGANAMSELEYQRNYGRNI